MADGMKEFDKRSYNMTLSKVGIVSYLLGLFMLEAINIYPYNIDSF